MIHLLGNVKENGGFYISCGSISYFAEGSPVCFKVSLLCLLCYNLFQPILILSSKTDSRDGGSGEL